ncbi:hypothetical protein [Caballeronia sp. SBC2]|uniref:hypothetical protein n=1 Tax=Caballeronia sp. SBC2 TaxID=2705547 RepID=UPI0013EBD99B|nr:hypothetical protein [Caballeronia sp. SBC2]
MADHAHSTRREKRRGKRKRRKSDEPHGKDNALMTTLRGPLTGSIWHAKDFEKMH